MRRFLVSVLVVFIGVFVISCTEAGPESSSGGEKINAAVSILPQAYFVERIGGENVEVNVMIPPGASPATYEPTPTQLRNLDKADIYFRIGHIPFEKAWMSKLKSVNNDMLVMDCSKNIEIIGNDPHIWLSPRLALKQVQVIYEGLKQVDPDNEDYYKENLNVLVQDLKALDGELQDKFAGKEIRKLMVYHPSWGYFASEYELEQLPIEKEGKEPSAYEIEQLIARAKENNINVILVSPQHSAKSAEVIAREVNAEVINADPLAKDYLSNMRSVADSIAENLE